MRVVGPLIERPLHQECMRMVAGGRGGGAPKEQMVPLVQSSGQHGDVAPRDYCDITTKTAIVSIVMIILMSRMIKFAKRVTLFAMIIFG